MSRTYRKSGYTFYRENSYYIDQLESGINRFTCELLSKEEKERIELALYRYMWRDSTDNKWRSSLPRDFRNSVNRIRRKKDRHEIWKAINWKDYEELCSNWNCKDNDHWGYW
jgi:hypothetical protein